MFERLEPKGMTDMKDALSRGAVPQRIVFTYSLYFVVGIGFVTVVLPAVGFYSYAGSSAVEIAETVLNCALVPLGMYWCYVANGANDGKDFLSRFVCVSGLVVAGIGSAVVMLWIASIFIMAAVGPRTGRFPDYFLGTGVLLLMFWRVRFHLREIATKGAG